MVPRDTSNHSKPLGSTVPCMQDQTNSDGTLDDVACMLGCTRSSLHGEQKPSVLWLACFACCTAYICTDAADSILFCVFILSKPAWLSMTDSASSAVMKS